MPVLDALCGGQKWIMNSLDTLSGENATSEPRRSGRAFPIGATPDATGVNFCLYSRSATRVDLVFFVDSADTQPSRIITLDPVLHRDYHYWHIHVPGVLPGQLYGYRVHGPCAPEHGWRFDAEKLLLDPYGRAVAVPPGYSRQAACLPGDNTGTAMKSIVVDSSDYDWEGDVPPRRPCSQTIIYEMHVRGFTRHPNSGVSEDKRGTYAGLIEKIPYLQNLGITAVELLPIFQFDAHDCPPGRTNYWGYAPISFFAPHRAYSADQSRIGPLNEFRDLVKALHRAGIEVILDVVFNHTAEGDAAGPTCCFRGLDNPAYYILEPHNHAQYANFSGTGNTLNANHPVTRRMILDSLRYWVGEMHVDGFRFDLASILSRDVCGTPLPNPPVLWDIESDPMLAGTKLIAEAWDAAGLYQVGQFVGESWREWNGRFRDDARDFFRGVGGAHRRFADRMIGSPEIFGHENREPEQSINFVTCHDGFTLNDLVSYAQKHNIANGENNRDGTDDNRSWNCGVDGPSEDHQVENLRMRQIKNFLTATLLSLGVPMILMGDECRRSQGGNNNPYCLDDETNWFDWSLPQKHTELIRFFQLLAERRLLRYSGHEEQRVSLNHLIRDAEKAWHGVRLNQPDWSDNTRCLAFSAKLRQEGRLFHFIFNAHWEAQEFDLPPTDVGTPWRRWIDTAQPSPHDITPWREAVLHDGLLYHAAARSVVVLFT